MRVRFWYAGLVLSALAAACSLNPQPLPPQETLGKGADGGTGSRSGDDPGNLAPDSGTGGSNGTTTSDAGAVDDASMDAPPATPFSDGGDAGDARLDGSGDGPVDAPTDGADAGD